jgi:hypothetical protein
MSVLLTFQWAYLLSHTAVSVQCLRYRLTIQTVHIFLSPFEKGRLSRAATYLGRAVFP